MTKRQREVFTFITGFIAKRGYRPSFQEIKDALGISSFATIHAHMQNLQRLGFISYRARCGRSIEITPKGRKASKLQTANTVSELTKALREFTDPDTVPSWIRNRALEVLKEIGVAA